MKDLIWKCLFEEIYKCNTCNMFKPRDFSNIEYHRKQINLHTIIVYQMTKCQPCPN